VAIPAAGGTGFTANFPFVHCNTGSVVATDTPTTSTINAQTTIKLQGMVVNPECAFIWSDNTNYWSAEILPTDANGRLQAAGMPALTGDVTNTAGALATVVGKINGTSLAGLGTGLLLNTTGTGVPSIATQANMLTTCADCVTYHTPATGIARSASGSQAIAGSELSGDATTSGSNAVTVSKINGTAFSGTATHLVAFGTGGTIPADSGIVDTAAGLLAACTGCQAGPLTGDVTTSGAAASLAAPFKTRACEVVWGGTGTSNALQSGDDAIADNSCYNEIGVTETITGIYCQSDATSAAPTVNPAYGASGSGTSILAGALTCGTSNAYLGTTSISNGALAAGDGINPVMGSANGHEMHMVVIYTVPN
jgi:hypothetical protein